MRRKAPEYYVKWVEHDVLKDFDHERLTHIGAISLQWNFIEGITDECVDQALGLEFGLGPHVYSRINGMDGKIAIIRKVLSVNVVLATDEKALCNLVLDAVADLKRYRDNIIHARIADPNDRTALSAPNKGTAYEIAITLDALVAIYSRLEYLGNEIVGLWRVLHLVGGHQWPFTEGEADPERLRSGRDFLSAIALIREHQSLRLSLPPLPRFLDPPASPPESEATQEHLD